MLRQVSFLIGLVVAAGFGLAIPATAVESAGGQSAPVCPDRLTGIASLVCDCPAEAMAGGSVWGTDVYTDDSAVCRAALHAGAIGADGGRIWAHEAPGQSGYPASTRHSVASGEWGQWGRSIAFGRVEDADEAAFRPQSTLCPPNADGLGVGTRLSCGCPPSEAATGTVWGSGPYTADSSICRAALHAGAVGPRGGEVGLRVVPGQDGYRGSTSHGIASENWGSYDRSFIFED